MRRFPPILLAGLIAAAVVVIAVVVGLSTHGPRLCPGPSASGPSAAPVVCPSASPS